MPGAAVLRDDLLGFCVLGGHDPVRLSKPGPAVKHPWHRPHETHCSLPNSGSSWRRLIPAIGGDSRRHLTDRAPVFSFIPDRNGRTLDVLHYRNVQKRYNHAGPSYRGISGSPTPFPSDEDDEIHGYAGNDYIVAGGGTDFIFGDDTDDQKGNDTMDGGSGADYLYGHAGNDTYIIDNIGDQILESTASSGGVDTVRSSAISVSLAAFGGDSSGLENITLTGSKSLSATGNSFANVLTGNGAANQLAGNGGNDRLLGGSGNDTLDGGSGTTGSPVRPARTCSSAMQARTP